MASEARQLRPFETLDGAQASLDELVQITGHEPEKVAAYAGQTLLSEHDPYRSGPFVLWFGRSQGDNQRLARAVVDDVRQQFDDCPGAVRLVVSLHNSRLKMTDVVFDRAITDPGSIPLAIDLHEVGEAKVRPRPLQTPGDGCRVVVELLLGRDLTERRPLRAWRKGSWLARVNFAISTSGAFSGPRPRPLTEAVRNEYALSPRTVHFSHVFASGETVLAAEAFDDVMNFYVDEDLLDRVREHPFAGWSHRLQRGWILNAIGTYLLVAVRNEFFDDFDPTTEPWSGSIMRAILDKVSGTEAVPTPTAALTLLQEDPGRFLAELEDRAELRDLEHLMIPSNPEEK